MEVCLRIFRGIMMARKFTLLLILLMTLLIVPIDVSSGATDFSELEWGFQEGDNFNYTLRVYIPELDLDISEEVTVNVTYLGEVPDIVDEITVQPFRYYFSTLMTWRNGTIIGLTMRIPNLGSFWSAIPLGNWSALNEVYGKIPEMIQIQDSLRFWGFTFNQEYGEVVHIEVYEFSKADGVIERFFERTTNLNGSLEYLVEFTRDGYVSDLTIFGGIIGVGFVVLFGGVIVKRRRGNSSSLR